MTSIYLSKITKSNLQPGFQSKLYFLKKPPRMRRRTVVMYVRSLLSLCVYINMFMECKTYPVQGCSVFRWNGDCFALLDASPLRTLPWKPLWPLSTLCTSWCKTLHSWSDHLRPHRSHPAEAENVVLWFMYKLEAEIHGCQIIMISTQWLVMPKWTTYPFEHLTSISSFSNVIPRLSKTWAFYMGILVQNKSTNDRSLLPG